MFALPSCLPCWWLRCSFRVHLGFTINRPWTLVARGDLRYNYNSKRRASTASMFNLLFRVFYLTGFECSGKATDAKRFAKRTGTSRFPQDRREDWIEKMKGWFDAFRIDGGPTLYSYSNRTPVTGDVPLVIVFVVFGTIFTAFLVIFPGIRKEVNVFPSFSLLLLKLLSCVIDRYNYELITIFFCVVHSVLARSSRWPWAFLLEPRFKVYLIAFNCDFFFFFFFIELYIYIRKLFFHVYSCSVWILLAHELRDYRQHVQCIFKAENRRWNWRIYRFDAHKHHVQMWVIYNKPFSRL